MSPFAAYAAIVIGSAFIIAGLSGLFYLALPCKIIPEDYDD